MSLPDATCLPLDHALAHAACGWQVFPLQPSTKKPAIPKWESQATTDEEIIRRWWTEQPDYNIGLACGPSGLVVIDCDKPKPKAGDPEAAEWGLTQLAELAGAHGGLEALGTLAIRTPAAGCTSSTERTGAPCATPSTRSPS